MEKCTKWATVAVSVQREKLVTKSLKDCAVKLPIEIKTQRMMIFYLTRLKFYI